MKPLALLPLLFLLSFGCRTAPSPPPAEALADIDRLLDLMNRRLAPMPEVAKWKVTHGKRVADPEREQALLDDMAGRGERDHGLEPEFTRAYFAAQIAAAKRIQESLMTRWMTETREPFTGLRDLAEVRKDIDSLNRELLRGLAEFRRWRSLPGMGAVVAERAKVLLTGEEVTDAVRREALGPLLDGSPMP